MTTDTGLRTRLSTAVDDTTVPPDLARAALAGGRRRRRRRTAGSLALAAVVVAGGATLLPGGGPSADGDRYAEPPTVDAAAALAWARSLPQGDAPALPFFGEGGLWSDGTRYDVPADVERTVPPRAVAGGWLVVAGADEDRGRLAVLGTDGSLRELPARRPHHGIVDSYAVAVSPDGTRVAFRDVVVDLTTMDWSSVPHTPPSAESDGYVTEVRMIGWTDAGLFFEGAPYEQGLGSTWLLRDDGTIVPMRVPDGSHVGDADAADVAVRFDYADDSSDTCVRVHVLDGTMWRLAGTESCMGRHLGEALGVSPDHRWLLTDDLPEVWNVREGRWGRVDMPAGAGKQQMDAQMGGIVWEGGDSFLLPVSDRWDVTVPIGESYEHAVQVVRCTMSTGECERAGAEQEVTATTSMWGTTDLRFAQP